MNHYMIDLETLDTTPSAVILSIGVAEFDPYKNKIGKTFYRTIGTKFVQPGRTISIDTVAWWMEQSDAAREAITNPTNVVSLGSALSALTEFLGPDIDNTVVWGNGATFDISILEHAYDYRAPWKFWNVRDMRTVKEIHENIMPYLPTVPFVGEPHNAKDDAIHQAKVVNALIKEIA